MTLFAETFQPHANQPNLPLFQNLLICSSLFFFYQDPTQMTSLPAQLVHSFKGFVLTSSPPPPTQAARFLSVTKTDKIIYPGPDKNFRLAIRYNWYCFLPNKFFDLVPAKKNCLGPDRIFCLAIKYNWYCFLSDKNLKNWVRFQDLKKLEKRKWHDLLGLL